MNGVNRANIESFCESGLDLTSIRRFDRCVCPEVTAATPGDKHTPTAQKKRGRGWVGLWRESGGVNKMRDLWPKKVFIKLTQKEQS